MVFRSQRCLYGPGQTGRSALRLIRTTPKPTPSNDTIAFFSLYLDNISVQTTSVNLSAMPPNNSQQHARRTKETQYSPTILYPSPSPSTAFILHRLWISSTLPAPTSPRMSSARSSPRCTRSIRRLSLSSVSAPLSEAESPPASL